MLKLACLLDFSNYKTLIKEDDVGKTVVQCPEGIIKVSKGFHKKKMDFKRVLRGYY